MVAASADRTVPVLILRDGKEATLTATIPEATQLMWSTEMGPVPDIKNMSDLGMTMEPGDGPATVSSVVERSIAWNAGLRKGDDLDRHLVAMGLAHRHHPLEMP